MFIITVQFLPGITLNVLCYILFQVCALIISDCNDENYVKIDQRVQKILQKKKWHSFFGI